MRSHLLIPVILFVIASGCQPKQVSQWSRHAKEVVAGDIAFVDSGGSSYSSRERDLVMEELDRYVADRQRRDLERENDRLRDELRDRGGGIFPLVSSGAFSASSAAHLRLEKRLARTYGITRNAARKFALLLGQTASGDLRGLHAVGLDERALREAALNGGRLSQERLHYASRRLGVSPGKLGQLMQRFTAIR